MFYNKNCVYDLLLFIIMFKYYNNIIYVSCIIRSFKHHKKNITYPITCNSDKGRRENNQYQKNQETE